MEKIKVLVKQPEQILKDSSRVKDWIVALQKANSLDDFVAVDDIYLSIWNYRDETDEEFELRKERIERLKILQIDRLLIDIATSSLEVRKNAYEMLKKEFDNETTI